MREFLLGFIACWAIIAAVLHLAETLDWDQGLVFGILMIPMIPVGILIELFRFAGRLFMQPWAHIIEPVDQKTFDTVTADSRVRHIHVMKNIYICINKAAKLDNRLYFVRVKKES